MRQLAVGALDGDGLGADAGQTVEGLRVPREVAIAGVAELDRADQLAVEHHGRPRQRPAAAALERHSRAALELPVRRLDAGDARGRRVSLDGDPIGRRPDGSLTTRVQVAVVHRDGEAQAVAVSEIDVAAGSSGEGAQRARRLSGNGPRVLDHQRHETEACLHDRAQVLGLAAQRREVSRLRGALALVLREQRGNVLGEVPAVTAGAAIGGEATHVGPPPHRVRADAERVGDVADAQPHQLGPLSHRRHGLPRSSRTISPYIGSFASELDQSSHASALRREVRQDDRPGEGDASAPRSAAALGSRTPAT